MLNITFYNVKNVFCQKGITRGRKPESRQVLFLLAVSNAMAMLVFIDTEIILDRK